MHKSGLLSQTDNISGSEQVNNRIRESRSNSNSNNQHCYHQTSNLLLFLKTYKKRFLFDLRTNLMAVACLWSQHHAQVPQVTIRDRKHQHEGVVISVSLEPDREVPDVRCGIAEHEQRDEDKAEDAETEGQILTSGRRSGQLDQGGEDPTKVVSAVEGKEAGDRGEVYVGPDVARLGGVLRGHQHSHTREDCQGREED